MRKGTVVLSMFMALAVVGSVLAHEGHEHKVMGTVAAIDDKRIEVTTKDEQNASVLLDGETKYFRGKSDATAGDVKVGERVVIEAIEKSGKMVARAVRLADNK